jgi:hypothetical protein
MFIRKTSNQSLRLRTFHQNLLEEPKHHSHNKPPTIPLNPIYTQTFPQPQPNSIALPESDGGLAVGIVAIANRRSWVRISALPLDCGTFVVPHTQK